jgi:hypothetical protein
MILLGVGVLVLSIIVVARNWGDVDVELLAWVGVLGGVAMVANALPTRANGQ